MVHTGGTIQHPPSFLLNKQSSLNYFGRGSYLTNKDSAKATTSSRGCGVLEYQASSYLPEKAIGKKNQTMILLNSSDKGSKMGPCHTSSLPTELCT